MLPLFPSPIPPPSLPPCWISADKTLFGINAPGAFQDSIQILPNTSFAQLCFSHRDDNITCEAPITGNVQLLGSPIVALGNPSTAQITIMDDDGKC